MPTTYRLQHDLRLSGGTERVARWYRLAALGAQRV